MRAFHVRFLLSGQGVEDKGVHTCEDHEVDALRSRFRQEAEGYWKQHMLLVNQVDLREVEAPNDPFVLYAKSLGLDAQRTWFPAAEGHAMQLDLVTPVSEARARLIERFGEPVTFRQDGSLYVQFTVPHPEGIPDCFVAIETHRNEHPVLWLKHDVDARFFPTRW